MSLSISEDNNVGSLRSLQLVPAYAFGDFANQVLANGYAWEAVDFLPESAKLTTDITEGDNGLQYNYTLTFAFNKNNAGLLASVGKYLGTITIARCTDNNGFVQVVGNLQSPIVLKLTADTGQKYTDQNAVVVSGVVACDVQALAMV